MFDPIRKLIAQNKLRQAFEACDALTLSASNRSQLIALRRRWDMISTDLISNTREERLIRIDENQLVQDLLAWLDHMDSDLIAAGRKNTAETSPQAVSKKKRSFGNMALLLLLIIGLGLGGTYLVKQFGGKDDPAPKEQKPTREDPRGQEATGEDLDPSSGKTSSDGPMMSAGPQVKLTIAVYAGRSNSTKYQEVLTNQVARYLSSLQSYTVPTDVLTDAFHNHTSRERLTFRAAIENPPVLNPNRAKFLLLIDFRDMDRTLKGYLRFGLHDVERKTGIPKGQSFTLKDMDANGAKQIARAAHEYLQKMKERGLFK